jgi:hypothetical protein
VTCHCIQVWTEALIHNQWIHIDPCEAAINEPLIYQGWGKSPTFIIAYTATEIDDVTFTYTSHNETIVWERRESEGITSTIFDDMLTKARNQLKELNNIADRNLIDV